MRRPDAEALAELKKLIAESGPPPFETWLDFARGAPEDLSSWPPARVYQFIRCRLRFSQAELSEKTGLSQSNLSRIEAGEDCLVSTMRRIYAAMGLELMLVPRSKETPRELESAADRGRSIRRRISQGAKPRRRWYRGAADGTVEESLGARPFPPKARRPPPSVSARAAPDGNFG